jgi:hypothetical protein
VRKAAGLLYILIAVWVSAAQAQTLTLSGYMYDAENGESLVGAIAYIKGTSRGVSANVYGFYSLSLKPGTYDISFSCVGYKPRVEHVLIDKDLALDVRLEPEQTSLQEVVISATKNEGREEVQSTQMSAIRIPVERIKSIPTIGGETDMIKVMQLMPGVKRGSEGQNGMFVRGGTGDANLILMDEAVVYNVSHLFGFFSVFNNDALKDVTLIKGGFPASYGGRLSSVLDIRMKEGDPEKYHAEGGIGLLSSRLTLQGPIIRNRMSFVLSGRRSYIDQVFKLAGATIPYYFYDLNAKLNYRLSDKDRLYLSTYQGDDILAAGDPNSLFEGGFSLGNITSTFRWNHLYSNRLFSNISLIHTRFRYQVEASVPGNSLLITSQINDIGIKADFDHYKSSNSRRTYGLSVIPHTFRPNVINTAGEISQALKSRRGNGILTVETGLYANNEKALDSLPLKVNYGARLSVLNAPDAAYGALEPRFSATYLLEENRSLKFGYSHMRQYMHLVSSSAISLPTDLWYPVTKNVKPQSADQLALGYTHSLDRYKCMFTAEVYYKWMRNLIEYRPGAVLILNDNYEKELIHGKGKGYGIELFLNKTSGRLTGWVGYTLSWATRQFDELNGGRPYYAKYDRRHDFSFVGVYDFTKRFSFSAVWVYSTGSRFTAVNGQFLMPNATLTTVDILNLYTSRNGIELPPAHRLDINFIIKRKPHRKWEGEWHIGAYNFYNRAQPYRIRVVPGNQPGTYKYQAEGLFGFIPSVAYNFKF